MDRREFLAALAAQAALASAASNGYTFDPSPAGRTLKAADGHALFSYLTEKPEGVPLAGNNSCCFHPLFTPSGERVTDIAPADHKDHRGAFFAWGNMSFNRPSGEKTGDYWGWGKYAPIKDRLIRNRELTLVRSDSKSAEVNVRNDWSIEGEKVLDENTTALVRTANDINIYDFTFRVKSDGDFTIRPMAFTGFCVRCRKDGTYFMSNPRGKVELPDCNSTDAAFNWPAEPWYMHTVALTSGKTISTVLVDHPQNPKNTWHYTKQISFLNNSISALGPLEVKANKELVLRYRVLTRDGDYPARAVDKLASEFRKTKLKG